jgi:hypothetical protein
LCALSVAYGGIGGQTVALRQGRHLSWYVSRVVLRVPYQDRGNSRNSAASVQIW